MAAFMPYIAVGVIDATGDNDTALMLHWILCCVDPPYTLLGAYYFIFRVDTVAKATLGADPSTADYFAMDNHITPTMLIMLAEIVLMVALLWYFEFGKRQCSLAKAIPVDTNAEDVSEEDDDVVAASSRARGPLAASEMVRLQGLRKYFARKGPGGGSKNIVKHAVRGLTFGIEAGEVFGLLGPNGAGKTTTISILTGEQVSSEGDAFIGGHSVKSDLAAVFKQLGFCPQFSALFPLITVWEHLILYARLYGCSAEAANQRATLYMEKMGIAQYRNVASKKLSGGTQRKLSVAIAMLGNPKAMLLDEPSSGMDPATRRFLWDVVREHSAGRVTILTTHSMEEADALCSRIGIMTSGKLRCVGSPQHLKSKFGTGCVHFLSQPPSLVLAYSHTSVPIRSAHRSYIAWCLHCMVRTVLTTCRYNLELKCASSKVLDIKVFMQDTFAGAVLLEEYAGHFKYRVDNVPSLGEVFRLFEEARVRLAIEEYSFSQPSLEQIFLDFAKQAKAHV